MEKRGNEDKYVRMSSSMRRGDAGKSLSMSIQYREVEHGKEHEVVEGSELQVLDLEEEHATTDSGRGTQFYRQD